MITWKHDPNIPLILGEATSEIYVGAAIVMVPDAIPHKILPMKSIQTFWAVDKHINAIANSNESPIIVPFLPKWLIRNPPLRAKN